MPQLIYMLEILMIQKELHSIKEKYPEISFAPLTLIEEKVELERCLTNLKLLLSAPLRLDITKTTKVSLLHRVYCGFDTEFENVEYSKNSLVSVQTVAVSTMGIKMGRLGPTYSYKSLSGVTESFIKENPVIFELLKELTDKINPVNPQELRLDYLIRLATKGGLLIRNEGLNGSITYMLPVSKNKSDLDAKSLTMVSEKESYSFAQMVTQVLSTVSKSPQKASNNYLRMR